MQIEIKKSKNKEMSEEAKSARRAYYRMYRAKNRERIKEKTNAWWERKAQGMNEKEKDG